MKYSSLVGIHSYFQDVFDLIDEKEDYWKRFITNDQFESNLDIVLECLTSNETHKQKAIWVQGTYGTGKSHSTSVIKHLLYDPIPSIQDYLPQIKSAQIRNRLLAMRHSKSVFPVVIKGVNSIVNVQDLNYVVQNAVKKAFVAASLDLITKTDFDLMLCYISDPRFGEFCTNALVNNTELGMYANNTDDLVQELNNGNSSVLKLLQEELTKSNLALLKRSTSEWLMEVQGYIVEKGIADNLVIFWDEFTNVLETGDRTAILNEVGNIAELSKSGVYLYLVTHKKLEVLTSYKELREDEKTMAKARFKDITFNMQPTTTYHIISSAIQKRDEEEWKRLRQIHVDQNISTTAIIDKLAATSNQPGIVKEKIKELYPLHPYTSYLATFVSRHIGSTERSIFRFLNDEKGFKKFLELEIGSPAFLPADYIWDFFLDDFEQDNLNKFDNVVSKFKLHAETLITNGEEYVAIFKLVLLLNILYKMTMTSSGISEEKNLVIPTAENIINAYTGILPVERITTVLDYIDENQIVHKSPEGIFEIAYNSLPAKKVAEEKVKEYAKYEDITKLIQDYPAHLYELKTEIKRNVVREIEVKYLWGGDSENSLKSKLMSAFSKDYTLPIAIMAFRGETKNLDDLIKRQERNLTEAKDAATRLSCIDELKNVTFIILKEPFGNKRFEAYVDNIANSNVAKVHGLTTDSEEFRKTAAKWVLDWVRNVLDGEAILVFRGNTIEKPVKLLSNYLSQVIIGSIFEKGLEKINVTQSIWVKQNAQKTVEIFTNADNRTELEDGLKGSLANLKHLLKDSQNEFIVDEKLNFRDSFIDHPLFAITKQVEQAINNAKTQSVVNLGETLAFLHKPPYGLYQNIINMATLGFALRPFIKKLYKHGSGHLIDKVNMRDTIVAIYNYWEDGKDNDKLLVRFSTDEERELVDALKSLFSLTSSDGLVNTKWALREQFTKNHNSPLWALKYVGTTKESVKSAFDKLFIFTRSIDSDIQHSTVCELLELVNSNYVDISHALINVKHDNGLINFIKSILGDNIADNDVNEVLEYLNSSLEQDKAFWEESEVTSIAWKWLAIKNSSNGASAESSGNGDSGGADPLNPDGGTEPPPSPKKSRAKERIKEYSGTYEELKTTLLKIVEDYPEFGDVIEKYFH